MPIKLIWSYFQYLKSINWITKLYSWWSSLYGQSHSRNRLKDERNSTLNIDCNKNEIAMKKLDKGIEWLLKFTWCFLSGVVWLND